MRREGPLEGEVGVGAGWALGSQIIEGLFLDQPCMFAENIIYVRGAKKAEKTSCTVLIGRVRCVQIHTLRFVICYFKSQSLNHTEQGKVPHIFRSRVTKSRYSRFKHTKNGSCEKSDGYPP